MMRYFGIFLLFAGAAIAGMIFMAPSEITFQVNEDFNAPVSEVFDGISNSDVMPKWINGVKSVKQTKGDGAAVGSIYDMFHKGEGNMVMSREITTCDVDQAYGFIDNVPDFMERVSKTTFEQLDSTHTRISTKVTMKALGVKMKLFMYNDETHIKNAKDDYIRLKEYLEK